MKLLETLQKYLNQCLLMKKLSLEILPIYAFPVSFPEVSVFVRKHHSANLFPLSHMWVNL